MTDLEAKSYIKSLRPKLTQLGVKYLLVQMDDESRLSYKGIHRSKAKIKDWMKWYMLYYEDDITRKPQFKTVEQYINYVAKEQVRIEKEEANMPYYGGKS